MKQIRIILLCIISFFCSIDFIISQNAGITTVCSISACPGTNITLPLSISGSPDISGIALRIEYDGTVLSFLQTGNVGTGVSNTNANLSVNGGNITGAQSTASGTTKKLMLVWISSDGNGYTVTTNGTGLLCNLQFRYLGGTTSLTFNNSANLGGYCEYSDNNAVALIDVPSSTYFISGTVSQGPAPSQPSIISGTLNPCIGSYIYSVINDTSVTSYTWSNTCNFIGSSITDSVTYIVGAGSNSGIISVIPSNACGSGAASSITITLSDTSTTASSVLALPDTICVGLTSTLSFVGGVLGTGANWYWYSGYCGGTIEGSGISLTVVPIVTTNYFIRAEGLCNTTSCISISVTVNDSSVVASSVSALPDTICAGLTSTLSVAGGNLGTGANWYWYSGLCGGTIEGSGTLITVLPSATTTYWVRGEGVCNYTACISKEITVQTIPNLSGTISGLINPLEGNIQTYSVTNILGVTYTWTAPSGWSGVSTTNSINYTVGSVSGNITVIPSNVCGAGSAISIFITVIPTGILSNENSEFYLIENYPNPFNSSTKIEFILTEPGLVKIDIYNILGEQILNVIDKYLLQGKYEIIFDASHLQGGLYPYKIKVSSKNKIFTKTKIMSIIK